MSRRKDAQRKAHGQSFINSGTLKESDVATSEVGCGKTGSNIL